MPGYKSKEWEDLVRLSIIWAAVACFVLASSALETASVAAATDKHPFNTDDYAALHRARAVAVSPDGRTILYQAIFDGASGLVNKHEWHLIDVSGENSRKAIQWIESLTREVEVGGPACRADL